MSYQISYGAIKGVRSQAAKPLRLYIGMAVFAAVVFAMLCFPSQMREFRRNALPIFEPEVTHAFSQMLQTIRSGTSVREAATAFCREILIESPIVH